VLKYFLVIIVSKITWLLPYPTKSRLIKIGNPTKDSPVLVTCNFALTVEKLKRVLKGTDLYLLVANTKGINVWCAAAGGHFTHHNIISIIKTSGIEELVNHKKIILPQLGAAGIETKSLKEKTGWRGIWGPVHAEDIPAFLDNDMKKTEEMRKVKFPFVDRVGVASAWAASMSVLAAIIFLFVKRSLVLPIIASFWGFSLFVFITFPLYERLINQPKKRLGFFEFKFELGGLQIILFSLFTLGLFAMDFFGGDFSNTTIIHLEIIALVIILILTIDLTGSTPIFKSAHHEELELEVVLNEEKCKGTRICIDVCPRNCFELDKNRQKVTMSGRARCEKCAACIVQCPFDALYFASDDGKEITPAITRKYKLNLMGKRSTTT
jgi:NAD-dependent dihydropyrimidine dehydrogenase PreA subunit